MLIFIRKIYLTLASILIVNESLATPMPKTHVFKNVSETRNELCLSTGCIHAASQLLKNMDSSINPCDDFYRFACGGFLKETIVPPDQSSISTFTLLRESLTEDLKAMLTEKSQPNEIKPFALLKQYYKTCMNKKTIKKKGLQTIRNIIKDVGGWPVLECSNWNEEAFDWKEAIYNARKSGYSASYFLNVFVGINPKNSSQRMITIDQASLGLTQKYLVKGLKDNVVTAYYNYMIEVATIFGANKTFAIKELKKSLEFEISLARISMSQEKRRNVTDLYHPMTIKDLQEKYENIPWEDYISNLLNINVKDEDVIILRVPNYFEKLMDLLEETPKRVFSNYITWRVVEKSVRFLTEDLTREKLRFDEAYRGVSERKHRSRECVETVLYRMDLAAGALYARRYFNKDAKSKVVEIMVNIRKSFTNLLRNLEWMDDATKESALEKVKTMSSYVAYSDELYDDKKLSDYYSGLQLDSKDYLVSSLNILAFDRNKSIEKLYLAVNKTDWTTRTSPAIVNAFYDPAENSIQFPAGILQGAYFDNDRPNYLNYGGIGYIIGHEITHGFDDKGRKYDKNGNLNEWWNKQTGKAFTERAQCMVDQYSSRSIAEIDLNLNGVYTQGENIADNGGLKLAYMSYQTWVEKNQPELKLPGLNYSPNQLFWISAANSYCSKSQPEYLKLSVMTDTHSPEEFRINVPFGNIKYFIDDFKCPLSSKMNPDCKCEVW